MKTLITAFIMLTIFGCSKESARPDTIIPEYIGTYNSNAGDTAYVTENGSYVSVRWAALSGTTITFDSVMVASDFTFTDNEYVNFGDIRHSLGTGDFIPSNTMYFKFVLDNNAQIVFNGIKQ